MSKQVGRNSKKVTEEMKEEAKEILNLAFKDVGGIRSKLTYNSVVKFNQHIANNPDYTRENGELFSDFGVRFWSKSYNDKPYYGKEIIDEFKKIDKKDVTTGGDIFDINNRDIESLVDRYHNNPTELKKRLINLFLKDRMLIKDLRNRNNDLDCKLNKKKKELEIFEEGFANLFWNSASTYNSLDDVLTLERPEDEQVNDELLNMFNNDKDRMSSLLNKTKNNIRDLDKSSGLKNNSSKTNNSINILDISNRLKSLGLSNTEDEGF